MRGGFVLGATTGDSVPSAEAPKPKYARPSAAPASRTHTETVSPCPTWAAASLRKIQSLLLALSRPYVPSWAAALVVAKAGRLEPTTWYCPRPLSKFSMTVEAAAGDNVTVTL